MKIFAQFIFSLLISSFISADNNYNEDYKLWLENIIEGFQGYSVKLTNKDKGDLDEKFKMKPIISNSGIYYDIWFNKAFRWFIDESNNIRRSSDREKVEYLMRAMPDLRDSGKYYKTYLQYVLAKTEEFLPVLNASEITCIELFKRAKPENTSGDYKAWYTEYNRIKDDYRPIYSDSENYILQFLLDVKPTDTVNTEAIYRVKAESLLKVKYLILNNELNTAANEIDKILSGEKQ